MASKTKEKLPPPRARRPAVVLMQPEKQAPKLGPGTLNLPVQTQVWIGLAIAVVMIVVVAWVKSRTGN